MVVIPWKKVNEAIIRQKDNSSVRETAQHIDVSNFVIKSPTKSSSNKNAKLPISYEEWG